MRCCRKSIPESEERDESVLLKHCFTTLPLTTTTGHHLTITYRLSSPSTLEGLRHIALSLVSGDVVRADDGQPRRRLNPETACQQWSDRIKTHCASSPAHVRTKRLQHYPWRTTPWSRYRYAYEFACDFILISTILLFRYTIFPSFLISLRATPCTYGRAIDVKLI